MMRLSTRSTYGIRALVELALTAGHGPISATFIAKRQGLPIAYLEQLLHRLKRHGLISSVRGPRGGYRLAKDAQRITMADVVGVLDGRLGAGNGHHKGLAPNGHMITRFANGKHGGGRSLRRPSRDVQQHAQGIARAVWRCVYERLAQSLSGVTLQDLCDEVRSTAGEPLDHRYVFHI
jgi:Rrf2 family iron-sulfur cluster assembly transcriptional regulator